MFWGKALFSVSTNDPESDPNSGPYQVSTLRGIPKGQIHIKIILQLLQTH